MLLIVEVRRACVLTRTWFLQLELIDFGATREYTPEFMDVYGKLLDAAIEQDREAAIRYSNELGYLTGQESEASLSFSPFHRHTESDLFAGLGRP